MKIVGMEKDYREKIVTCPRCKAELLIEDFDDIFLIMEGKLVASGTHEKLLKDSLEYNQIFNSQKRTE